MDKNNSPKHEINNQVATITSVAFLLERLIGQEPLDKEKIKLQLEKLNKAASHITEIVGEANFKNVTFDK